MTIREWRNAKGRAAARKNVRETGATWRPDVWDIRGLRKLTDAELIAKDPALANLSHQQLEMEMQRRLKDSIEELTKETAKARWWAFWGSAAIAALTVVLVVLTVVLALKA